MSFQTPANRTPRWSVVGMEAMFAKMFDPPTLSPATPDLLLPTNPAPEVMLGNGTLSKVSTPHTVERDLLHGLIIKTWDGLKDMDFMTVRDADSSIATGTFPGPACRIPRGAIFHATTAGHGPPPHTIHWHGLEPTPINDGVGHCSMEIGSFTYQFQPNFIGTYFYHCHRNTVQHFDSGLYGMFIVEPSDAYHATLKDPAIPVGHGRDGLRRTAANVASFPQFPNFNSNPLTTPDAEYGTDPHAMTVAYDVEAMWVFDDRDSVWSQLAPNARATYPRHGDIPGVNDNFHGNAGGGVGPTDFFAFNDFNADYWYVTGVPIPAHRNQTGTVPEGTFIPAGLNGGIPGTQVALNAPLDKTILIRCQDAAYNCTNITFPVDVVIIAWDGRALGIAPFSDCNHAYLVPAGQAIPMSTARRFDALVRSSVPINDTVKVEFYDTRGMGVTTAQPLQGPIVTALIPFKIGVAPVVTTSSLSGIVKDDVGLPLAGVQVTIAPQSLGGGNPQIVTTGANGTFSVTGLINVMYEITAVLTRYTFNPPVATVSINNANVANLIFIGTQN